MEKEQAMAKMEELSKTLSAKQLKEAKELLNRYDFDECSFDEWFEKIDLAITTVGELGVDIRELGETLQIAFYMYHADKVTTFQLEKVPVPKKLVYDYPHNMIYEEKKWELICPQCKTRWTAYFDKPKLILYNLHEGFAKIVTFENKNISKNNVAIVYICTGAYVNRHFDTPQRVETCGFPIHVRTDLQTKASFENIDFCVEHIKTIEE